MDVMLGFSRPDVAPFPADWEMVHLGACLTGRPTYGINAASVPYSDRLPVYIRITDITPEGYFVPPQRVSVRSAMAANYYLYEGDIVFARTGASVGKSYRYKSSDGPLVYAGFLIRLTPNSSKLLPEFVAAYVTTGTYWRWVRLMSMRSGQPGINGNEYGQLPIPLPPLPEQHEIVTVLRDVDAVLSGLDRLIAKKQNLKKAVTQSLLSGQRRLPGFNHGPRGHSEYVQTDVGVIPNDWRVDAIETQVSKVGSGITPTGGDRVYRNYGRPFVRSQNVGWGHLLLEELKFIDDLTHNTFPATEIEEGDVFLNITGASIGRSAVADSRLVGGNVN